jgi:hypothetical protein
MAITLEGTPEARRSRVLPSRAPVGVNWGRVLALLLNVAVWVIVLLVISRFNHRH